MATPILSREDFYTKIDDKHLELFCLIWLDANVTDKETKNTEQTLRSIINYLKRFQNVNQCQEYIEQRSQKDRLVLIVSGRMGRQIVPSIHKLRQVVSIYIYCMDEKGNKEWARKYKKVRAVVVELDELISQIKADHKIQKKVEEPLSINFFVSNQSTTGINGEFLFSQVLIDCLLQLKYTQTDYDELIELCQDQYKGNPVELSNIHEFKNEYSPNKVLWWYTRESFFYKTLNAALREKDIHTIFLFRSFISDIYDQLLKYQSKKSLKIYRSQMITSHELKSLTQRLDQHISVNSFFSTSTDDERAASFLEMSDISDDLERVLFEIDADPKMAKIKPFADIRAHSEFIDEAEVLFMLGSIFRLKSINRNDDQVWVIRMTLCSYDEHALKQVFMHMKKQNESGEINLRTLGKLLWKMGKFELAKRYLNRFLNELLPNDPLHSQLYEDLSDLAGQTGDYNMSIEWQQKLIAFNDKHQSNLNPKITKTNNSTRQTIPFLLNSNMEWKQYGLTIAGGHERGNELNQLNSPSHIYIDDDHQCIYIADHHNHRIVEWKYDATSGQVVAGGNEEGNKINQLSLPTQVMLNKKTDSLIICDQGNRRVVQWPRQNGTNGQIIISDVDCWGVTMNNNGDLYVSHPEKNEVSRWKIGEQKGTIVAGGNGKGKRPNQLNWPNAIFVDEDHTVYVSDQDNHRVMKWMKGAKEGVVVAGGQGKGDSSTQLCYPKGVIVDHLGNVYVADSENHRLMCWSKGSKEGRLIVGGNDFGYHADQFHCPISLSFDRQGHLYVVDLSNNRIQKFDIDLN